jgi:DNA-3-methyladenine glycosylase
MPKLERQFFEQPTLELAKNLLGCSFVHFLDSVKMAGVIVETEAYLWEDDPACHASKGQTKRNSVMFGPPGCLYVYSIHNRYCMNIVSEPTGQGSAVLIRAIEPTHGLDLMDTHRAVSKFRELTNGPGKLCQSFAIDLQKNGEDLVKSKRVWLESKANDLDFEIRTSPRIGISQARERPYRFFVDGNPFVSGRATDHSRMRDRCLAIPQKVSD